MSITAALFKAYCGSQCRRLDARPGYCAFGCGRRWQFATSNLGGHAVCAVTTRFMLVLRETMDATPGLGDIAVSRALGVNRQIVRRWYSFACKLQSDMPLSNQRPRVSAA